MAATTTNADTSPARSGSVVALLLSRRTKTEKERENNTSALSRKYVNSVRLCVSAVTQKPGGSTKMRLFLVLCQREDVPALRRPSQLTAVPLLI